MPSRWVAFGLLAVEALCAGTPLIASDCIGLREVVEDTPAVVVPPGRRRGPPERHDLCTWGIGGDTASVGISLDRLSHL